MILYFYRIFQKREHIMSEKEDRNTIEETAPAAPDINEETGLADGAGAADDMDL